MNASGRNKWRIDRTKEGKDQLSFQSGLLFRSNWSCILLVAADLRILRIEIQAPHTSF